MAYEIMDHDVLRDGVKVAEFGADGTLLMSEGCDAYLYCTHWKMC